MLVRHNDPSIDASVTFAPFPAQGLLHGLLPVTAQRHSIIDCQRGPKRHTKLWSTYIKTAWARYCYTER
jgi:hypothetical protein